MKILKALLCVLVLTFAIASNDTGGSGGGHGGGGPKGNRTSQPIQG